MIRQGTSFDQFHGPRILISKTFVPALVLLCLVPAITACGGELDDDIDQVFDPCSAITLSPTNANDAELQSIHDAVGMWNGLGAELSVYSDEEPSADTVIPIEFEDAAPMFRGIYRDEIGDVVINRSLSDQDKRAVVIAHELGHAFGLVHVEDDESVMMSGNVDLVPGSVDVAALTELWPDCSLGE